jgi:abortive infection bacteriophage resistance protein
MAANSKEEFVAHFRQRYSDPLPIWAAVELWDFGMLSMFIGGMKYGNVRNIATKYGILRPELFPTWVRTLAFVRNICAHHGRLWNKPLIAQPKPPKKGEIPHLDHIVGDSFATERFYAAAAIARHFQLVINPTSMWGKRFTELVPTFPKAPGIVVGQAGFPNDWHQLALWK